MPERHRLHQPFGKRQTPPHRITIDSGGRIRRLTLPRWTFLAVGAAFGLMTLWTAGTTGFIVFRDDFIAGMMRRQAAIQYDYEDKITALKSEIARLQSRQLIDGQAFSQKVDTLLRRQATLESRQTVLQSLADMATSAGVKPQLPPQFDSPALTGPASGVPQPLPDDDADVARPGKQAALGFAPAQQASVIGAARPAPRPTPRSAGVGLGDKLSSLTQSLDTVDGEQMRTLTALETSATARTGRVREALDEIGLDADRFLPRAAPVAEGGPYIPADLPLDATPFDMELGKAQAALSRAEGLDQALTKVPLRRPFPHAEITSGFGVRIDPFLGTGALHAGIDFREEIGAPVRATASGVVTEAGWSGGYGNMVEIDHGNGLSTRYGHMSEILVTDGEHVEIGQIIGRVGSTGRSTGPHLHYETRIHGSAVDPMRFLRAGRLIGQAT
ncbi:M23 family metallopeptidase [Labrys wisconsinensis]|uniref:Murein DD-endopeptidase MepM/ murein hydrolase activator NlpD n=1 Tax=Labrys wisconsinensis TaxID=425677 RepID=A0ABU0J426_9HYPH|nr:M23 family metallopeptidase [Labrys wisconsinensis]MDQ0469028.1 murein DD-endopeptidase MepM/ murein hydrolase activator NlpD [Labrys wisconsinensis]